MSNGEDFITTEQLQRRMRNLSSSSTGSSYSNNVSDNSSQKRLNDDNNDFFPKNGLPDDSPAMKDEDANDTHGKETFLEILEKSCISMYL